jgi:hypothetical protein
MGLSGTTITAEHAEVAESKNGLIRTLRARRFSSSVSSR